MSALNWGAGSRILYHAPCDAGAGAESWAHRDHFHSHHSRQSLYQHQRLRRKNRSWASCSGAVAQRGAGARPSPSLSSARAPARSAGVLSAFYCQILKSQRCCKDWCKFNRKLTFSEFSRVPQEPLMIILIVAATRRTSAHRWLRAPTGAHCQRRGSRLALMPSRGGGGGGGGGGDMSS